MFNINEEKEVSILTGMVKGLPFVIFAIAAFIMLRWVGKLCLVGPEYLLFFPGEFFLTLFSTALCCLLGSICYYITESVQLKTERKEFANAILRRAEKEAAAKEKEEAEKKKQKEVEESTEPVE